MAAPVVEQVVDQLGDDVFAARLLEHPDLELIDALDGGLRHGEENRRIVLHSDLLYTSNPSLGALLNAVAAPEEGEGLDGVH